MEVPGYAERRQFESLPREALAAHQLRRLNELLATILPGNALYAEKLRGCRWPLKSLEALCDWPLTEKNELANAGTMWPRNATFSADRYVRFHQTSGSKGSPLSVVDTAEDWVRWLDVWQYVFDAANVLPGERAFFAFSFGPFIGFWTAFDAIVQRGCLAIPSGGLTTLGRLEMIERTQAEVLLCTPSYALRLAEVAAEHNRDLRAGSIRKIIVAGEPGGSLPATRRRIEDAFAARVTDHAGATEVGPWGYADEANSGLHIAEAEFIAEFIEPETGQPAEPGQVAELVLTNLFRAGCPVIRYRTGDLVRPIVPSADARNQFVLLEGGVLGRADDMLIVRGVNVFPSALEQIVRSFPETGEFRAVVSRRAQLDHLCVEVEATAEIRQRLADELRMRLGLNIEVTCMAAGALPRTEGKAKRLVDQRDMPT